MKHLATFGSAALLLTIAPALADVRAGVDAWSRGDWAAAVREWQAPAASGDPDAQFNLGQAYRTGRGVPRDAARAEALYRAAATKGHLQAADNLGLLLYQRGEFAAAMPLVRAAAGRGDPRAQYYLGIAHFNGEHAAKDWVRAYALVSIAQQAGLEAATRSLAEMDRHVPLEQRQKAVALSAEIIAAAEATRARELAALDLGTGRPGGSASGDARGQAPSVQAAEAVVTTTARAPERASPRTAGADYARPAPPPPAPKTTPPAARPAIAAVKPTSAPKAEPSPAPSPASGPWRVQLGAFAVAANADALWARVKGRPELAGHQRIADKGGKVTRLLAGGFASQDAAQAACRKLATAGHSCLVTRN